MLYLEPTNISKILYKPASSHFGLASCVDVVPRQKAVKVDTGWVKVGLCSCGKLEVPAHSSPSRIMIRTKTGNAVSVKDPTPSNTANSDVIHYIPKGSTDINFLAVPACLSDCTAVVQVFHTDGTLLVGSPVIADPRKSCRNSHGSSIWALWSGAILTPDPRSIADVKTALNTAIVSKLSAMYAATFAFDDSKVNGTGNVVPYSSSMTTYRVDGETIEWNGDQLDGWSGYGYSNFDNTSSAWVNDRSLQSGFTDYDPASATFKSKLHIAEAKQDLIVLVVGTCLYVYKGSWIEPAPPEPEIDPVPAICDRPRMWQKRDANENKQHFGL